jgi:hypothetical protein
MRLGLIADAECEPADGTNAAAENRDFGMSRPAAPDQATSITRSGGRGMTACGTKRPIRNVRYSVAIEGKADMCRMASK